MILRLFQSRNKSLTKKNLEKYHIIYKNSERKSIKGIIVKKFEKKSIKGIIVKKFEKKSIKGIIVKKFEEKNIGMWNWNKNYVRVMSERNCAVSIYRQRE